MTSAANTPSVRRIGPLCVALGVTLVLLFAGLLAVTDAPARADTGGEGPPSAEQSPPSGEEAALPPVEEPQAPETAPAQGTEAEETPAAVEETPPPASGAPPVEPPPAQPVEAPAPPEVEPPAPVEEAPAMEAPAPVEEPVEVLEQEEEIGKAPIEATDQEATGTPSQSSTGSASIPAVPLSQPGDSPKDEASLWPSGLSIATTPPARSKHRAPPAGCGLEASIATSCAVGWLSLSTRSRSPNTVLIASGSFSSQITGTETEDASHRRTSVENTPSTPTPAQGPGGSGGVSAAGGGSSAACSAFNSAGVKLRHSQIYTRAVILDQPSWRTSFFVLVPERPG